MTLEEIDKEIQKVWRNIQIEEAAEREYNFGRVKELKEQYYRLHALRKEKVLDAFK